MPLSHFFLDERSDHFRLSRLLSTLCRCPARIAYSFYILNILSSLSYHVVLIDWHTVSVMLDHRNTLIVSFIGRSGLDLLAMASAALSLIA